MKLWYKNETRSFVTVLKKQRPYKAPVSWSSTAVPGGVGVILGEKKVEPATIPVRILVDGNSQEDYRRKAEDVAAWLDSSGVEPLFFDDDINRRYYAVLTGDLDPEEIVSFGFVDVSFFCPDGRKYGNHQIDTFTIEKSIINQSTAPALPIFNVHFTEGTTNFEITNNGQNFRLIREFVAGDRVVIDCKRGLVQLNGLDAMPIRDWRTPFKRLTLEPGENQLTADPVADVEVTFTERYL